MTFLASIPSPSSGTLDLGPLTIHMYGLMLLAGIAACIALTGVRWVRRGGDWDLIFRVAVWGVGAGIVGARLYHILTSWDELPDEWWGPFAVWEGGLGIWGGIGLGVIVGSIVAHRSGASALALLDAAAPGLLVAQAIGRVGNWWNQELFGEADRPGVGARDRPGAPAGRVPPLGDVPSHFPLRGAVEPRRGRGAARARPLLPLQAAGALRPLRGAVHRLPLLPRAAARRSVEGMGGHAHQRVGLARALRRRPRLLHLVAVLPRPPRHARSARRSRRRRAQSRGARPPGRWRCRARRVRPRR